METDADGGTGQDERIELTVVTPKPSAHANLTGESSTVRTHVPQRDGTVALSTRLQWDSLQRVSVQVQALEKVQHSLVLIHRTIVLSQHVLQMHS